MADVDVASLIHDRVFSTGALYQLEYGSFQSML